MSDDKKLEEIFAELRNLRDKVNTLELLKPVKHVTITYASHLIKKEHFYYSITDVPGEDKPVVNRGYVQGKDKDLTDMIALASIIKGTKLLPKTFQGVELVIDNDALAEYLTSLKCEVELSDEIKERLDDTLQILKENDVSSIKCQLTERMKQVVAKILGEINKCSQLQDSSS